MKTIKGLLSVLAIVIAVGATFATKTTSSNTVKGYVYLSSTNMCAQVEHTCVEPNETPCEITVGGQPIRENAIQTSECGNILGKP